MNPKSLYIQFKKSLLEWIFHFQDIIGNRYSSLINSEKYHIASMLSTFLPNNGIVPIRDSTYKSDENRFQRHIVNRVPEKDDFLSQSTTVLIITPRRLGNYPNVIFEGFQNFLREQRIQFQWHCLNEMGTNYLEVVSGLFSDISKHSRLVLVLDPLAPTEIYSRYRNMDADWINTQKKKFSFSIAVFLGDIWRAKDRQGVNSWVEPVDTFFHVDPVASHTYPEDIRNKMFFYPFVSFPVLSKSLAGKNEKKHQVLFSGQVRDSDRRWWLRQFSSLTKKSNVQLITHSWYKFSSDKVLSQDKYLELLAESSACFGLSQRGTNHWILPARSFEALRMGTVLIQQEGPNCSPGQYFLKPYEDYIPFISLSELRYITNDYLKDYRTLQKIATNGQESLSRHYPAQLFIRRLLS